jgi:hypothetical protein
VDGHRGPVRAGGATVSTSVYQCGQCGGLADDHGDCRCLKFTSGERSRRRKYAAKKLGVDQYDYVLEGDRYVRKPKSL